MSSRPQPGDRPRGFVFIERRTIRARRPFGACGFGRRAAARILAPCAISIMAVGCARARGSDSFAASTAAARSTCAMSSNSSPHRVEPARSSDEPGDPFVRRRCGPWAPLLPREPTREVDLAPPSEAHDVVLGVSLGVAIPGNQDLKFKRYDAVGAMSDFLFSNDVNASDAAISSAHVTVWRKGGAADGFGLRLEGTHWTTRTTAGHVVERLRAGSTAQAPPFHEIDQDRFGLFASVARRFSPSGPIDTSPYVFGGLGVGAVRSRISRGDTMWGPALGAHVGVSVPLADRLRVAVEGRFVVTHDVDVRGYPKDWHVDTSGTPTILGQAHLDTRFYALTIGIELRL